MTANGTAATELNLRAWLRRVEGPPGGPKPLLVGGTGHLLLTSLEEARVITDMVRRVLPAILDRAEGRRIVLFSGLAPGADLIFLQVAHRWLQELRVDHELVGVLPVPPRYLVDDWLTKAANENVPLAERDRARVAHELESWAARCAVRVRLSLREEGDDVFESPAYRNQQYRQLGAVLAQHAEVLVAVLRVDETWVPGGTAEVVQWHQNPRIIPAEYTAGMAGHGPAARHLYVINPAASGREAALGGSAPEPRGEAATVDAAIRSAESALAAGNDLLCNDIVYQAQKRGLRAPRLDYLKVLSLANVGSPELALDQYRQLDLHADALDEDWLALRGRIQKDLAQRSGAGSRRNFERAAESYLEAYQRFGGYYSGINAASMFMLAGQPERARELARETLGKLAGVAPTGEGQLYYLLATEAEAALLLGDPARCAEQLTAADELLRGDVARRGRTVRQLRRLCRALHVDPQVLAPLKLPPVVVLRRIGALIADPNEAGRAEQAEVHAPAALEPGVLTYAGLCDPLDLRLAEAAVEAGARLYVTLPRREKDLRRLWQQGVGIYWAQRLEHLLAKAERVTALRGFLDHESGWAAQQVSHANVGLSLLSAARQSNQWRQVDVEWDGSELRTRHLGEVTNVAENTRVALAQAGYASRAAASQAAGRRMVGLIFADFSGFQRITDVDLPRYWSEIMSGVAQMLDKYGDDVLLRHTWGDALHVVTVDATTAADLAADIQHFIALRRLKTDAALSHLEMRIAAHYAPAFVGHDPIQRGPTYYGSQLSFAARIEPVAPPGMVYVTEAFASRLALEEPERFALEYAGEVELAKRFGSYRVYSVRRLGVRD